MSGAGHERRGCRRQVASAARIAKVSEQLEARLGKEGRHLAPQHKQARRPKLRTPLHAGNATAQASGGVAAA